MSEFYKELRVDNGLRKIGVNDKGDYLEISINDSSVFDRFADLMTWLQISIHAPAKGATVIRKRRLRR